jgi:hypothetical protein
MKVRVYFCREIDAQIILKGNKISKQALNTIYELVRECEFKNILNVGSVAKVQRRRKTLWYTESLNCSLPVSFMGNASNPS